MRNVYIFYDDGAITGGGFTVGFLNFLLATGILNMERDIRKNNIFGEQR